MKIAYISAGAAGMYCGSCLRDSTLAAALQRLGHDVALIPTYTPLRTEQHDVSIDRVFYGAINVYLEQKSAIFRHTPWLVDRLLNQPALLGWASNRGASIDPRELGDLTLSVLQGEHGKQKKELEKLVAWLRDEYGPDVVQLTNSMLLGLAHRIREVLDVPVLCAVQGEDIFVEGLNEPYRTEVRELMQRKARDANGLIATSRYYAEFMTEYLQAPPDRMHHVPLGLSLDGHGVATAGRADRPFTIGYLARICPEKGLHLLADAFRQLSEQVGKGDVRLRVAGWLGERDRAYVEGVLSQLKSWGLDSAVDFLGEVDRSQKIDFLNSLHVLSVPTTYHEPKGLFVLEALANGVPVVQPSHGAFPELIEATGGGVLFEPGSTQALARALGSLMHDSARRAELGRVGQAAVRERFNDEVMAGNTLNLYRAYVENRTPE
jgi:glycosyltransferase involved in cell wall biosynthesis